MYFTHYDKDKKLTADFNIAISPWQIQMDRLKLIMNYKTKNDMIQVSFDNNIQKAVISFCLVVHSLTTVTGGEVFLFKNAPVKRFKKPCKRPYGCLWQHTYVGHYLGSMISYLDTQLNMLQSKRQGFRGFKSKPLVGKEFNLRIDRLCGLASGF